MAPNIDGSTALVKVNYNENGVNQSRDIKFKGNFGFNINGENFYTKNGKVYNSKNEEVNVLTMSQATAYQFIGMSCTAESARDYTYSAKDIKEAESQQNEGTLKRRAASTIGTGAGKVVDAIFNDKEYSTIYRSNENNMDSAVSIWLNQ